MSISINPEWLGDILEKMEQSLLSIEKTNEKMLEIMEIQYKFYQELNKQKHPELAKEILTNHNNDEKGSVKFDPYTRDYIVVDRLGVGDLRNDQNDGYSIWSNGLVFDHITEPARYVHWSKHSDKELVDLMMAIRKLPA